MKKKKKITRAEKIKLSSQGICWKCNKKTLVKKDSLFKCTNCGFSYINY